MMRSTVLVRTIVLACLLSPSQTLAQKPKIETPYIVEVIDIAPSVPAPNQADDGSQPLTPIGNQASWVTTDDYPAAAQRIGAEGVSSTRLHIDINGRVTQCEIVSSSGNADLDTAACAALTERARFEPARDRRGRAVAGTFTKRVRWVLPTIYPPISVGPTEESGLMVLRVHILPRRRVDFCEVINIKREKSDLTERLCPHALDLILLSPEQDIPQEGLWFETILSQGMFSTDPDWMEQDEHHLNEVPLDEALPFLPPPATHLPSPEPLPEGVT